MSNLRLIVREIRYSLPSSLPSLLSVSRIALAPIFLVLLRVQSNLTFPLYLVACVTDFLDGKLARFLESTSKKGEVLDASADFFLISVGFYYYISLGLVSPLLLVVMTLSFLQYILTSRIPIDDHLGKHVGTILYILLAVMILSPTTQSSTIINFIGFFYIIASLINRFHCIIIHARESSRRHRNHMREYKTSC